MAALYRAYADADFVRRREELGKPPVPVDDYLSRASGIAEARWELLRMYPDVMAVEEAQRVKI